MNYPHKPSHCRELLDLVRANARALKNCPGPHDFHELPGASGLNARHRCSKCAGEIDGVAYSWYVLGLDHGSFVEKKAVNV